MNTSKTTSIINFLIFTLLPLFSTSIMTIYFLNHQDLLNSFGVFEWGVFSILFALASALALCPPTFLAIIMGYFLAFKSIPFLLVINFGAIFIVYFLAKFLNFNWVKHNLAQNENALKVMKKLKSEELKIIFFAKLSPILPFALTNLLFAISGAKLKNVIIGGFFGMIPRTLLAVYTGSQAKEIKYLMAHPNEGLTSKIIVFSLILISVIGAVTTIKKALLKDI